MIFLLKTSSLRLKVFNGISVLLVIPQRAYIVAFGNALRQIQDCAITLTDAVVTAHGNVAKLGDLFVGTSGVLPGLYQRAVVEIQRKLVIGAFQYIHFKYKLCGLGEQSLFQAFETVGIAFLHQVSTLGQTAALNGGTAEVLGIKPPLLCFVAEQLQPEGTMLQQCADCLQESVFVFGFVFYLTHKRTLLKLDLFDKVLIKQDALTNVLNGNILVLSMDGGELLLIEVDGCETKDAVCNIRKAPCIGAGGQKEGRYNHIGEILVENLFQHLEGTLREGTGTAVVAQDLLNFYAVFVCDLPDRIHFLLQVFLTDTTQEDMYLRFLGLCLGAVFTSGMERSEGEACGDHGGGLRDLCHDFFDNGGEERKVPENQIQRK